MTGQTPGRLTLTTRIDAGNCSGARQRTRLLTDCVDEADLVRSTRR